ncbi:MAG: hypothetical protein V4558_14790 [Gemmatimonadota bacterium]
MKSSPFLRATLVLAAVLAFPVGARAQGGGGGMAGGFGGGMPQAPRLVQGDVSGPPGADSVRSGLKLDSTVAAGYATVLTAHLAATAALRDSVGRSAEAAGIARAKFKSTATLQEQTMLALMLDKLVKRVRKADDDFLEQQVKPLLSKDQWKRYKKWIDQERTPSF